MRRIKLILLLAGIFLALSTIVQIGLAEWQNLQFQDDLHDLAANLSENMGVVVPRSDAELRALLVHKASERDIELDPQRITVQRTGSSEWHTFYLAVDYEAPIRLPGYSFALHFSPSSTKKSVF
jgi:hypothetical protein